MPLKTPFRFKFIKPPVLCFLPDVRLLIVITSIQAEANAPRASSTYKLFVYSSLSTSSANSTFIAFQPKDKICFIPCPFLKFTQKGHLVVNSFTLRVYDRSKPPPTFGSTSGYHSSFKKISNWLRTIFCKNKCLT